MLKLKSKTSFKGGHYTSGVGKTSKTRDPKCSKAMSDWKSSGKLTHEIALILGKCRSQARQQRTGAKPSLSNEWAFAHKLETRAARPTEIAGRLREKAKQLETQKGSTTIHSRGGVTYEVDPGKAKFIGKPIKKEDKQYANVIEREAADKMKAKWLVGNEPFDAEVTTKEGITHHVESKSKLKGESNSVIMTNGALADKHIRLRESDKGKSHAHLVVTDHRDRYDGGKYKHLYSGHDVYYKRGVLPETPLKDMHRVGVDSKHTLMELRDMPEHMLPEKAKPKSHFLEHRSDDNSFNVLRGKGEAVREREKIRTKGYKKRMKDLGTSAYAKHSEAG